MAERYPLVRVTWVDAATWEGTCSIDKAITDYHLVTRHTVGYLIVKDTERLLIVHTLDEAKEDEVPEGADFTVLPRHWAVKIVKLETGKEL